MPGEEAFRDVRKLGWHDPRPPLDHDPEWAAIFERIYAESLKFFEDQAFESWMFGRQSRPLGIPRQEPRLGPLPIITRDETENHYGTSGELDPRGYWMPLDEKATL